NGLDGILNDVSHHHKGGLDLLFRDVKDHLLCHVEKLIDVASLFKSPRGNFRGRGDKMAKDGFFPRDAGVVADVGGGGDQIGKGGKVGGSPHGLQLPPRLQEIAQRDEINRLGAVGKVNHGAKNIAVG